MTELTVNQREFVAQMAINAESADYGFGKLAAHPRAADFFPALISADLLTPIATTTGGTPGTGSLRFSWRALDYLLALADTARETDNRTLGDEVARVTLAISIVVSALPDFSRQYFAQSKFVEILSSLPEASMTEALIDQLPQWMGPGDGDHVLHGVIGQLMPRLLTATTNRLDGHALKVLDWCTEIRSARRPGGESEEPATVRDSYFVNELLKRHGAAAVQRLGMRVLELWRDRARSVFPRDTRREISWARRPAIEEHEQNMAWYEAENMFVEALRDGLMTAVGSDLAGVVDQLTTMYRDGTPIERRIAIHVFNESFDKLGATFLAIVDARLVEDACLHESYRFLQARFQRLPAGKQAEVLTLISGNTTATEPDDIGTLRALRMERNWLSAIQGRGYAPADARYQALVAMPKVGPPLDHPDFFTYHTSMAGPGPSVYTVDDVIAFLRDDTLIDKLTAFQESPNDWQGPTIRALVDVVDMAVREIPEEFLAKLSQFNTAPREYQYAVIAGFQALWNQTESKATTTSPPLDWSTAWPQLLDWMAALISPAFWAETPSARGGITPDRDWIPGEIAEFIQSGSRTDEHAFDAVHLPKAAALLQALLEGLPKDDSPPESDPLHEAVNSWRGRVLRAYFGLALRWCRVLDKSALGHDTAWAVIGPVFTDELDAITDGNYAFSALAAQRYANLHYLNPDWLATHAAEILSPADDAHFRCAMSGVAFGEFNGITFDALVSTGALDRALALPNLEETPRTRLLERLALAAIWGKEAIDSSRMRALLASGREKDLIEVLTFFWSVGKQPLEAPARAAILSFWRDAVDGMLNAATVDPILRAAAAKLIIYLDTLDAADEARLVALAPTANAQHSSYYFVEELHRLVPAHPDSVARIALAYLNANGSEYDYQNRWHRIAKILAASGLKLEAIEICEIMLGRPGFQELYLALST